MYAFLLTLYSIAFSLSQTLLPAMKCLFHPFSSFTLNSLFTHSHVINTHHKALSISCHAPLHIWTYLNVLSTFDQSPNSTHSTPPSFPSNYLNSTLIILKTSSPHMSSYCYHLSTLFLRLLRVVASLYSSLPSWLSLSLHY